MPSKGGGSSVVGSCTALPVSLLFYHTTYTVSWSSLLIWWCSYLLCTIVSYTCYTLKNFQQFFYTQETNLFSNCFIQLLYSLMMDH